MSSYDLASAAALPVTFTNFDNSNTTYTIADLDSFNFYNVQICIIYASQLGASLMLLVTLILLSNAERRKTLMFALNALALLLNTLRMLFLCLYFTSTWSAAYVYFVGAYDLVASSDYGTSIVAVLFTLFTLICVEACLVLQTQVVLVTLPKLYRRAVIGISAAIATATVGLRIAYSVYNIKAVLYAIPDSTFDRLSEIMNIITTVSICWFSAIFTVKLTHALLRRRQMGLQAFGPMDVLCIMGGQTMIIPAILSIIWHSTDIPSMSSTILTVTAIFLPLSSLWAASIIEGRRSARHGLGHVQHSPDHDPSAPHNDSGTLGGTTFRSASTWSASKSPLKIKAAVMGFASRVGGSGRERRGSRDDGSTWASQSAGHNSAAHPERGEQLLVDLEKQGF